MRSSHPPTIIFLSKVFKFSSLDLLTFGILTVNVDWSRPQAGLTWRFEAFLMELMKEMPVAAAARQVNEHDMRLWRVLRYYVNRAMVEMDVTGVKRIAIDETSSRRGHQYITLFVDADTKRLLFATPPKCCAGSRRNPTSFSIVILAFCIVYLFNRLKVRTMLEIHQKQQKTRPSETSESRALLDYEGMLVKGIEPPTYALRVRLVLAIASFPCRSLIRSFSR